MSGFQPVSQFVPSVGGVETSVGGVETLDTLADLRSSPSDKDRVDLEVVSGQRAHLLYDAGLDGWRFSSEDGDFVTVWEGDDNPWIVTWDAGGGSVSLVDGSLQADLTADAINTVQIKGFRLPLILPPVAEIRMTVSLEGSGVPATNGYRVQPRVGVLSGGRVVERTEHNIQYDGNVYQENFVATDGNGNPTFDPTATTGLDPSATHMCVTHLSETEIPVNDVAYRVYENGGNVNYSQGQIGTFHPEYWVGVLFRSDADLDVTMTCSKVEVRA